MLWTGKAVSSQVGDDGVRPRGVAGQALTLG